MRRQTLYRTFSAWNKYFPDLNAQIEFRVRKLLDNQNLSRFPVGINQLFCIPLADLCLGFLHH